MKRIDSDTQKNIRMMRKTGHSHRQIARNLCISVGTAHKYSNNIRLSANAHYLLKLKVYNKTLAKLHDNSINSNQRHEWCRKGGLNTPSHFKKTHTEEELIKLIKKFYSENKRIPTKRDMPGISSTIRRYFGSWNNAISKAGYEPNPVLFAKKQIADDGHICDSHSEKIIDDWLSNHKIRHEKHIKYPNSNYKTDFVVGDVYIEFFGLYGKNDNYDRNVRRKLEIIKDNDLTLISIYPKDLFPISNLDKILGFLV